MTWSKIINHLENSESDDTTQECTYEYVDTHNVFDTYNITRHVFTGQICDFIQYIDKMLCVSTTVSNILDTLNMYEYNAYAARPIHRTKYDAFIDSLNIAFRTL